MTERGTTQDADPIRDRYRVTYGVVPVGIDERLRVAVHARGALHAGASLAGLVGVAETALITTGAPGYALGMEIVNGFRRYHNFGFDSFRWKGFRFRPGDIVISTPAKSGTTWMQMLCARIDLEIDVPSAN